MNTDPNNESNSNYLSIKNLEKLRESILDFEMHSGINNEDKITKKQASVLPNFQLLDNTLIQIKNLSLTEDFPDIVKLSESTSVFLKYINDSKINYNDENVLNIIKYIIYCFKSLFLSEKISDFKFFVDYLNNPVKVLSKK